MSIDDRFDDLYEEDLFSDEELDALYRPRKQNSRKSLVPLFVYRILQEKSSDARHLSQNEILAELRKYPYEVELERKALSRLLHGLADSGLGILSRPGQGAWYTRDRRYWELWNNSEDCTEVQSSVFCPAA